MFEKIITSNEVKFNDLEKKVFKFICFFGCLIIKLMLEAYDKKLMNSRENKKYRHKGLRETTVNTVMGEVKYKRVMYEIPEAPAGLEYRTMGTQESQIFSKLKKRFCSGRKAFSKHGANSLSKICVLSEKFKIEELETPIPVETSVEDWIKEIEEQVRANKRRHCAKEAIKDTAEGIKQGHIELRFMKEIMKIKDFAEMRCSF